SPKPMFVAVSLHPPSPQRITSKWPEADSIQYAFVASMTRAPRPGPPPSVCGSVRMGVGDWLQPAFAHFFTPPYSTVKTTFVSSTAMPRVPRTFVNSVAVVQPDFGQVQMAPPDAYTFAASRTRPISDDAARVANGMTTRGLPSYPPS